MERVINIMLVEDDLNLGFLLVEFLEQKGMSVKLYRDGQTALTGFQTYHFDFCILDVMLPKMDGFEMCRLLKQDRRFSAIPVIILTAKGEEVDRIVGLELGADDYIVKPFSPRELVLRAKAVLRRGQIPDEKKKEILSSGDLVIDVSRHKVMVKDKSVALSPMEFKLLSVLVERTGRVQSRDQLLTDVWGMSSEVTTRTIDTHVKLLRQKLGKAGDMIQTVRGIGYKIDDEE